MEQAISILKSDENLTSYRFYTDFLSRVADFYKTDNQTIAFKLFEKGDQEVYSSTYRIDPLVIPLLLCLAEQLSKFHKRKLPILLNNNPATIDALEFLVKCDFFHVAGTNQNPIYPKGRNILEFNENYFGSFKGKKLRNDHKVRAYSLTDEGLSSKLALIQSEEDQRDFLMSHFTYKVRDHFQELLFDNEFTSDMHHVYIEVLSELISNAVMHSKSNAFALMFVDRYKTKFSIADNGVGLEESMKSKKTNFFFEPNSLRSRLTAYSKLPNIPNSILGNLQSIFEALFYSALKNRKGLFDLMTAVVIRSHGYFRLHCENSQIIISNRMRSELVKLRSIRKEIYKLHTEKEIGLIQEKEWIQQMSSCQEKLQEEFVRFFVKSVERYHADIKYSSLRFYPVKFRGVHIEVEIPNVVEDDNI